MGIQALAYLGKIAIHPVPIASFAELFQRAAVGPIPGEWMLVGGVLFNFGWILFALVTLYLDRTNVRRDRPGSLWVESGQKKRLDAREDLSSSHDCEGYLDLPFERSWSKAVV